LRSSPIPARLPARAVVAVLLAGGLAAGCRRDMQVAPRYDPLGASAVFPNGSSAQPIVEGTVARGHLDDDALLDTGKINGQPADEFPFPITAADLDRGQQRYDIFCSPCHGLTGDGNGMVIQRGFDKPAASYHTDRLRQKPVGYFFGVITNGFGAMPAYRAQIPVPDRWRIIAYVRALQLSRNATTTDIPADVRANVLRALAAGGTAPSTGAPAPAPEASGGGSGGHPQ
jgi:mono/diheme cytochrome c family protein